MTCEHYMIGERLDVHSETGWPRVIRSIAFRATLLALIWWILTEGARDSWLIGIPVVLLATFASRALLPDVLWSPLGILRFMPFFLWHSIRAGVDVARRALHPRLPISPGLFDYPWRLPPGLPRVFMANTVSLLPGTLSTELNQHCLRVHVLDLEGGFASELATVEARVAELFRLAPINPGSPD